ncbi:WD40 repeat-like protein [Alternaria alternata]|nr:WD40 repeat-like protein [Alternaria alternata]
MTAKSSSGANNPAAGKRSTKSPSTPPRSTWSHGPHTRQAVFWRAHQPTAMFPYSNSRTTIGHTRSSPRTAQA